MWVISPRANLTLRNVERCDPVQQGDNMQARPPQSQHERVRAPGGPTLRPGETRPEDVRAWRRDRIAHCIGTLLRDPSVARSVAQAMQARKSEGAGDGEGRAATHILVACPSDFFEEFHARRRAMAARRRQTS
jgi:hypothetical protein